jgi:hypothetical protein
VGVARGGMGMVVVERKVGRMYDMVLWYGMVWYGMVQYHTYLSREVVELEPAVFFPMSL